MGCPLINTYNSSFPTTSGVKLREYFPFRRSFTRIWVLLETPVGSLYRISAVTVSPPRLKHILVLSLVSNTTSTFLPIVMFVKPKMKRRNTLELLLAIENYVICRITLKSKIFQCFGYDLFLCVLRNGCSIIYLKALKPNVCIITQLNNMVVILLAQIDK